MRLIFLNSLIYCVTRVSFQLCSLVVITFRKEPSYHVNRNGIKRLGYYLPKPNYSTITVGPGVLFLHDTSSIRWGLIRSGILGDTSTHVLVPQFPLENGGLIPEILQKILMMVYSTVILPKILGQPHTNCNKSKLNCFCFLYISTSTGKKS